MKIQIGAKRQWVNYHHLYCFFVVAREGGLAKASRSLGIGASALSIQIKQFESALGVALFERTHRKLRLTENGALAVSYAKEIFRLGGEMVESINDRPHAERIHLQVGVLDTIPKHLSVQLVRAALRDPKCTITILEGSPAELLRGLIEHRIDLLLTNDVPVGAPGQLYTRRIARLPLLVVGAERYVALKKGFPRSLEGQAFVVPTADSRVRHEFESFCQKVKVTPIRLAEAQDVMIQKMLALEGIGLTIAPELAVKEYLEDRRLFVMGEMSGGYEELFLVTASRTIENPVAGALMKNFRLS